MSLPEFSIDRPVTILMFCIMAVLLGGIAFVLIPVDLMPEIVRPTLTVSTTYEGVAPEEVENLVTRPLEEALAGAPGVERITSSSSEGASSIRVEFPFGTNMDEAANELRTRIDRRRGALPEDIEPPTIFKFDVSQFPIMFLNVSAAGMGPKELRQFVEQDLQYRFERVPGVAQFTVRGGLRRQIHVDLDLKKLRALNLSVNDVVNSVRRENINRPAGQIEEGRFEVLLRTQGEYKSMDQLRSVLLATRQGVPIYLRDIATVSDSVEETRYITEVNGQPAVRVFINKQSGANTVEVSKGVWAEVAKIERDYPNVKITAAQDSAEFIKRSIDNVKSSAIYGSLLAVLILLFFLRSFSSTIIIGTAIPIAVIATFALMYFNGFTLNVISFGGLALGVGMLVDNAIVVLENIYRHREQGASPREAARVGSREVAMAITASTLTTIVVFAPVVFIGGMSAQTFQQLAWVVSFSLICSLLVALTLVPMLSARFLRASNKEHKGLLGAIDRAAAFIPNKLTESYSNGLSKAVQHRGAVALAVVALFAGSLFVGRYIGVELQPEVDEGEIRVSAELEPGTKVEETFAVMERLAAIIRRDVPEAAFVMVEAGNSSAWRPGGQNEGNIRVTLVDQSRRTRSAQEIVNELRKNMTGGPGVTVRTMLGRSMMTRVSSAGSEDAGQVEVEVRGYDLDVMRKLAERVRDVMSATPGVATPFISMRPGIPEMLVEVDRPKAASLGLNVSDVAATMETAVGGTRASMYREEGDEFDIVVRLQESDRLNVNSVQQVPLSTPGGQTIEAKSIISLRRQEGPNAITRADQQRVITVTGELSNRPLGDVMRDLDRTLGDVEKPDGYEFVYGGEYEEQQKAFRAMTFAAILALILVYMVMAMQFESLRDPFIILFSIPLASVGVVAILILTATNLNIQGFLGIVILLGIVVNNAIVLVDYTNLLRREYHMPLREAVVMAGARRLRPILMTTATTVLGLLPMALGIGEGGELQAPLARVVIGGLTTSTLITLFIVPIVYLTLEERAEKSKARAAAELRPATAPGD